MALANKSAAANWRTLKLLFHLKSTSKWPISNQVFRQSSIQTPWKLKGLIGFEVSQIPSNHTICNLKVCWQFHLRQPQKGLFAFQELYFLWWKMRLNAKFNFRWMDVTQTRISKTFNIQEEEKVEKGNGSAISNKV